MFTLNLTGWNIHAGCKLVQIAPQTRYSRATPALVVWQAYQTVPTACIFLKLTWSSCTDKHDCLAHLGTCCTGKGAWFTACTLQREQVFAALKSCHRNTCLFIVPMVLKQEAGWSSSDILLIRYAKFWRQSYQWHLSNIQQVIPLITFAIVFGGF